MYSGQTIVKRHFCNLLIYKIVTLSVLALCSDAYAVLPAAPSLISPNDYYIRYNQTPHSFSWNSVSSAVQYEIYIDNNSGFGSPEIIGTSSATSYSSSSALADGVYSWMVHAKNSSNEWGAWSTVRRFVVDTPPPSPSIIGPGNGSSYYQGDTVSFSWDGPSGYSVNRYYIRIVQGTDLNATPQYQSEGVSSPLGVSTSGWPIGTYTWGIRAIKNAPSGYNQSTYETAIGWGSYATHTFTINTPPAPIPPTLSSPANGATIQRGQNITFQWANSSGSVSNSSIKVCTDSGMSSNCKFYETGLTQTIVGDLTSTGTYYWQARSKTASSLWGIYGPAPAWNFTISDASPVPPTLSSPANGATIQTGQNITFQWANSSDSVSNSSIKVCTDSGMSSNCKFYETGLTQTIVGDLTATGTYYWQARSKTSTSAWGIYGPTPAWTFTVNAVNLQVTVTPSSGELGTTFQEPGTGFSPNSTATLHFKQPNGIELTPVTKNTDSTGAYNNSWASTNSSPVGMYQYWAVDDTTGNISNTATFTLMAPSSQAVWVPVYRLYKSADNDHFYTTNAAERDNAVKNSGYKYEKIEFYISDRPFTGGTSLYRFYYEAAKKHYYTTNPSSAAAGYTEGPGVIGYVYPNPTDGMAPLYHLEGSTGDHFYSISKFERDNAVSTYNFIDWGIQCYVSPSVVANNRPQGDFAGIGMFSGSFSVPFTDISLSGVGPALILTRYYNSYNFYELPFSGGWSHSLYSYAMEHPNGAANDVTIKWGNGTEDFFKNDGANNFSGVNGTFSKLVRVNADKYELTSKDQTIYTFSRVTVNSTMGASFIPDLPLISIQDKFNNKVVMSPNAAIGRIDQAYRTINGVATGQSLTFNYDIKNRLISVVDTSIIPNRTITYGYNTDGYLSSVTDAHGNTTQYAYTTYGLLNTITYPEGNTVTVVYDQLQRVTSYTNGSIILTFDYNATTGTTVKNGASPLVNFVHDPQLRANTITYGGNVADNVQPSYYTGNQLNLQQSVKDRNGNTSYFTYDVNGNLLTAKNPLNETTTYTYDAWNNLTSVTDPRNTTPATSDAYKTKYIYDPTGKYLQSVQKPMGGVANYTYYTSAPYNGLLKTVTVPTTLASPTSYSMTYSYDTNGNVSKINDDALNTSIDFINDNAGRRISQKDQSRPTPVETKWGYDNNDNVTSVQVGTNPAAIFNYDKNNRLKDVTDQRSKTTSYTYNAVNLLETTKSPDQKTWRYFYDGVGNLSSVNLPDTSTISYEYYPNNRLKYVRQGTTEKLFYTYDNNGNILTLRSDGDSNKTTTFQYDVANRITSVTDQFNNTIGYGYDMAGNRTSISYDTTGTKVVNYTYDQDNRLVTVKDWLNSGLTTYNYNSGGILQSISNANGTTTTLGYDPANRLKLLANKKSDSSNIASYLINQLDNVGNPLSITRDESLTSPIPAASDTAYTYDDANEILTAGSVNYTPDLLGNVGSATNGRSFTFDYVNHLTNTTIGGDTFAYAYDGFGNRISRTRNGTQTKYLLDLNAGMSNVLAETDAVSVVQNYYLHGLGLLSRITPAGQRYTYHYDTIGNTVAITDDSGTITESYTYDEFGAVLASSGTSANPFRYVGRYGVMDEGNGLLHMRARYYDTDTGRFMSRDPLGFDGGDLNLYRYADNNTLVNIDPNGMFFSIKDAIDFGYEGLKKVVCSEAVANWGGDIIYNNYLADGYYSDDVDKQMEKIQNGAENIMKLADLSYKAVGLVVDYKSAAKESSKLATSLFGKTGILKMVDMRTKNGRILKTVTKVIQNKVKDKVRDLMIEYSIKPRYAN